MLCPKCFKAELAEKDGKLTCPHCQAVMYLMREPEYPQSEEEYILWQ